MVLPWEFLRALGLSQAVSWGNFRAGNGKGLIYIWQRYGRGFGRMVKRTGLRKPNKMDSRCEPDIPDKPERIVGEMELRLESIGPQLGGKRRYRNVGESPLTRAWYAGRIDPWQHAAGDRYRRVYETRHSSSRSLLERVSKGGNTDLSDAKCDASNTLGKLHRYLSNRDRIIVENLCGQGESFANALRKARFYHPKHATERVRDALDRLAQAFRRTQ